MKKIIISPFSRVISAGKNPKNYPYWNEVVKELKDRGYYIIQIGNFGEEKIPLVDEYVFGRSLEELEALTYSSDAWLSVDNFYQHFCHFLGIPGIVIFGYSDPEVFGYKENKNLLKSREYLRPFQFQTWNEIPYSEGVFVKPEIVINEIISMVEV